MRLPFFVWHSIIAVTALLGPSSVLAQDSTPAGAERIELTSEQRDQIDSAIKQAFEATHKGWSSDEVILQDELNQAFLADVKRRTEVIASTLAKPIDPDPLSPAAINWRLMTLRKAGKLDVKTTRRSGKDVGNALMVAEVAMRTMQDKHSVSSDQVMTDPQLRKQFDHLVKELNPDTEDVYLARKAAFQLRKTRRLQPELITRIADWGRQVTTHPLETLEQDPTQIPSRPGIYLFRDSTGYLYIGQAENLQERLQQHFELSHNQALAKYLNAEENITIELHAFDPESRAREVRVRRAYESALIANRKPRFNIQP